jgi:hypothetical protein
MFLHQFASSYLKRFIYVLVSAVCFLVRQQIDMLVSKWLFARDVEHQHSAMQFTN